MKPFTETAHSLLSTLYSQREINRICRLLLEKRAGVSAASFHADKDRKIPACIRQILQQDLERLVAQEPLEYVLEEAWFDGLLVRVDNRVLIPRPETEELVDWISRDLESMGLTPGRMLDVCTGSGCIALALANRWSSAAVEAWDLSPEALTLAAENATRLGLAVTFKQVDVLQTAALPASAPLVDLLVSNPPYVCRAESATMKPNVLDYEPHMALFVSDEDPLVFYRALARLGQEVLTPEGRLYVEINGKLGAETLRLFQEAGYADVTLKTDLYGKDRFVRALKQPSTRPLL